MTSLSSIGMKKSNATGRTVRDIVEHYPEQISEVWCRKVLRQLLQLLERQYAMQLPHRVITPDTVFIHDNGNLQLLPSLIGDPMPEIADDLTALARIVHYAITQEVMPTGPLRGRAPEGFSDSLINAIDRCMAADPARRPRTIGELRELLGIVPFRHTRLTRQQAHAVQAAPAPPLAPQVPRRDAAPDRRAARRHWAWRGAGVAILLGAGLAVFANLRQAPTLDRLAPALPGPRDAPRSDSRPAAAPPVPPAAPATVYMENENTPAPAPAPRTVARKSAGRAPVAAPDPAPSRKPVREMPAPPVAPAVAAAAAPAADTGAVLTLRIQPWGRVYVDGVERGISPPVKRLALAPGRHLVLVANPGSRDRVLEVDTAGGDRQLAVDFESGR